MAGEALRDFLTEIGGHEWVTVRVRPHVAKRLIMTDTGYGYPRGEPVTVPGELFKAQWEFVDSALAEKYHAVLNPLPAP